MFKRFEESLSGRWISVGAGVLVTLFIFVLYVRTLAPTVMYYERPLLLDSAMLQVQAILLGIPGGTGSPTWVMLTHLFTYLPFGDPAYRTNLSSAVYATGAVALVYAAARLLGARVVGAAAAAIAYGLGTTLWSQAVITEVYTLNAFLIMIPVVTLLLWRKTRRDRYLLLTCFLMGFAMTNHMTSGLVLPAAFLFVGLVDWRKLLEWRLALKGAGLFLLGLLPYVYLPLRSSMDPPMNEFAPTTLYRFWYLVGGGDHQNLLWAFGPLQLPRRFELYLDFLFQNFHWSFVMAALVGVGLLVARDRAAAVLVVFLWAGWLFHAMEYNIFDYNLYFIWNYLMVALAAAYGISGVLDAVEDLASSVPRSAKLAAVGLFSVAFVLLGGVRLGVAYEANDESNDHRGQEIIDTVARDAAPNAMILHHRSSLWYMVLVEKRRQDIKLADPWVPGRYRYTDIVWPDDINYITTNLRYGTNDETGVSTARIYAREGPVYILDQESAGPQNFINANFDIIRVKRRILYELVPPGGTRYTPEKDPTELAAGSSGG